MWYVIAFIGGVVVGAIAGLFLFALLKVSKG